MGILNDPFVRCWCEFFGWGYGGVVFVGVVLVYGFCYDEGGLL